MIFRDFDYDKTATTVTSTVADAMAPARAALPGLRPPALACLRSHGVAARYVSGYPRRGPRPARSGCSGADACMPLSVWLPPTGEVTGDAAGEGAGGQAGEGQWLAIDLDQRSVGRRPAM
ncbi:MAG: hypothetical protein R2692_02295 [Microbacterium sp.]